VMTGMDKPSIRREPRARRAECRRIKVFFMTSVDLERAGSST
jgi:hypothetical protein